MADKKSGFSVIGFIIFCLIVSFWIASQRAGHAPAGGPAATSRVTVQDSKLDREGGAGGIHK